MNIDELIQTYAKEMEEDTQIDSINIMQKQLSSPNIKHKWLYRAIQAKRTLIQLNDDKNDIMVAKMMDNPLQLSNISMKKKAEHDKEIISINREIKQQELLIEYLDRAVDKIFSQIGFDFKNLVELLKLEQL